MTYNKTRNRAWKMLEDRLIRQEDGNYLISNWYLRECQRALLAKAPPKQGKKVKEVCVHGFELKDCNRGCLVREVERLRQQPKKVKEIRLPKKLITLTQSGGLATLILEPELKEWMEDITDSLNHLLKNK